VRLRYTAEGGLHAATERRADEDKWILKDAGDGGKGIGHCALPEVALCSHP
jgi:hypothetical protein